MKKWILYRHTSPSGKVYIGITSKSNPNWRWQNGKGYVTCIYFYNAILKHGWDNIRHEILFRDLNESTAKGLEIELIRHYKDLGISYNITDGGEGSSGYKFSLETIEKIANSLKGLKQSKETIAKRVEKNTGKIRSDEQKSKTSKKVIQYDLKGNLIKTWPSALKAAEELNLSYSSIYRCCKNKKESYNSYIWKFEIMNI